jgi:hypothetical protein
MAAGAVEVSPLVASATASLEADGSQRAKQEEPRKGCGDRQLEADRRGEQTENEGQDGGIDKVLNQRKIHGDTSRKGRVGRTCSFCRAAH